MNDTYAARRRELDEIIYSISLDVPLRDKYRALMLWLLNSAPKIKRFNKWVNRNKKHGILQATEQEIVRAAVRISKRNILE